MSKNRRGWFLSLAVSAATLLVPGAAEAALVTLTGSVTDTNGVGIAGVRIDFVDSCTGVTALASGNVTSSIGSFRAVVNSGIYDIEFAPPVGTLYAAHRMRKFNLSTSQVLAPIALPFGVVVSGRVFDALGTGLPDVFVRFFPPGSSERVFTVRDRTDFAGRYDVVVLPGTYDVKFGPPLGTRHLGLVRSTLPIVGNTRLPDAVLTEGWLLSGVVLNSVGAGKPVINVNLDVIDAVTGLAIFQSHDRTDANGAYSLAVPPGTYRVRYKPQRCHLLVAAETAPLTITADTSLPAAQLAPGILVDGLVQDARGAPVFDVNVNYIGSGGTVLTPDDHTDALGAYSAVIPPDLYNIEYNPPVMARLAGVKNYSLQLQNSQTLVPVVLPDAVFLRGRTVDIGQRPIAGMDLDVFPAGTGPALYTPHDRSDTTGAFLVAVPPGVYDVRFDPAADAGFASRLYQDVSALSDVDFGDVVLLKGYTVSGRVIDETGLPLEGVDLDFFDHYTREKIDTVRDTTGPDGTYQVVVPARLYDIRIQPPSYQSLATAEARGVIITAPTAGLDFVLRAGLAVRGTVVDTNSSPVPSADVDVIDSATGSELALSRDNTGIDGSFLIYLPPGAYDFRITPLSIQGLATATIPGIPVTSDTDLGTVILGPAVTPSIASITPTTGPMSGGTSVIILGSRFQAGAAATLGGLSLLSSVVIGSDRIEAITPGWPGGDAPALVDLEVRNHGAPGNILLSAFTYAPVAPISLSVQLAPPNVALSWPTTGQPFYTIYRSTSPGRFGQTESLAVTSGTMFVDFGAAGDGLNYFYRVE